jgi:hypothetical protein
MMTVSERQSIRVPNLPFGKMVDENGHPVDDELSFRQALVGNLQQLFGNNGVAITQHTAADITIIQNNQNQNGQYTCQFGTLIYDTDNNVLKVALDNGGGQPIFKTIVTL